MKLTVSQLITILSELDQNQVVHADMDDYPHVTGVKTADKYDGPEEYAPPPNTVLLEFNE